MLKRCYINSIELARDFNCKRIAFPCLGMGVYGCPIEIGGKIAIDTIISEIERDDSVIDTIYLVCYGNEEYEFYIDYFNDVCNKDE